MAINILSKSQAMENTCSRCQRWTIKGAVYCHHCGFNLTGELHSHSPAGVIASPPVRQTLRLDWKAIISTKLLPAFAIGVIAFIVSGDWWYLLGAAMVVLALDWIAPGLHRGALDWVSTLQSRVKPLKSPDKPLRVEHIDDYQRPRLLHDMHKSITLQDLAWLHYRIGQGAKFSRRGMCRPGRLSQAKYEQICRDFVRLGYAEPKNGNADNLGIELNTRGRRVIRQAYLTLGPKFESGG